MNETSFGIRTVAGAADHLNYPSPLALRQMPGQWPQGNALVGRTFFLPPPTDGEYRGDYLLVGTPPPKNIKTNIPKSRRIFLLLEPPEFWKPSPEFLENFGVLVAPYHVDGFKGLQVVAPGPAGNWWYGIEKDGHKDTGRFLSFEEIRDEPLASKENRLSVITSAKNFLPGQKDRLAFIKTLTEVLGDKVEVFGYGFRPIGDKRDALRPFQFHLALENSVHSDYWTEKLSDPLLGRCITFYHGATRIRNYFPEKSVVPIDIYDPQGAIETIRTFLNKKDFSELQADIESARQKILFTYNSPFFIDKLIDKIEAAQAELKEPRVQDAT
jgi:hypothetical protein